MEQEYEVIKETPTTIVLKNMDGKVVTTRKIDKDDLEKQWKNRVKKVADAFNKEEIIELISILENILNNIPTVDQYFSVAKSLTCSLQTCYDRVGQPNLFWHPIKNINPEIYGKANTLSKEVKSLLKSIHEVAEMMKEMGKIQTF
ncbi:hypothetical protein KAR91_53870 [Candidatus Pacearchaeota archaeon]|nr:hypothetical protein [Candidatus Pacearchaeota archaeon]